MIRILVLFAVAAFTLMAADVTGKWKGTAEYNDGEEKKIPVAMDLKQEGSSVTGKILSDPANPYDVKNGKVDGNKFVFVVSPEQGDVTFTCAVSANELKCTADHQGTEIKATVTREQ